MNPAAYAATVALLQFVWQGSVVAVLLAIVLALLPERSANLRYLACCLAMIALVALPLVTGVLAYAGSGGHIATAGALALIAFPSTLSGGVLAAVQRWALPAWGCGVAISSMRLFIAWRHVARLRRSAVDASATLTELLASVTRRLGLHRRVRLALTELADSPVVIGWWRPMVLLPASTIVELTREQLEAILAHELAHVRRYDDVVNVAQAIVETVLFYHPATWWVSTRLRRERERSCDDSAVALSGDPSTFVRALLQLEHSRRASPPLVLGIGGAENDLLSRIRRLLGGDPPARRAATVGMAIAGFMLLACVGSSLDAPAEATGRPGLTRAAGSERAPGARDNLDAAIASTLASRIDEPVVGRQLAVIQIVGGQRHLPKGIIIPAQLGERISESTRARFETFLKQAHAPFVVDIVALPGDRAAIVLAPSAKD